MQHSLAVDYVPSQGKRVVCRRQILFTVVAKCAGLREMSRTGANLRVQVQKWLARDER
jgi:hypothetical protein